MIGSAAHFPYYQDNSVQIVSLPFENNEMQMLIILPREGLKLIDFEMQLTGEMLIDYINALETFEKTMVCFRIFLI